LSGEKLTDVPVVNTIENKCKACYSCVRNCPVKAIKVEVGQTRVVRDRCISCGDCVKVCSQNAKEIFSFIPEIKEILRSGNGVALLAPSFPASCYPIQPEVFIQQLYQLGFKKVIELTAGIELTVPVYREFVKTGPETVISTYCPAIVELIERYFPRLIPNLAPVDSALMAIGKHVKKMNSKSKTVFIGPCIAKKEEVRSRGAGIVDAVITFKELKELLNSEGLVVNEHQVSLDTPVKSVPSLFPLSGGLARNLDPEGELYHPEEVVIVDGKNEVMEFLESLAKGKVSPKFVDILFCKGCIDGPEVDSILDMFSRKHTIYHYARSKKPEKISGEGLDLGREFTDRYKPLPEPTQQEIQAILKYTYKTQLEDELNCGACGYNSCREKAVAVYQGLAEIDMCLPYLLENSRGELEYYKVKMRKGRATGKDIDSIISKAPNVEELKELAMKAAQNDATILIQGESGVGKEVFAQAIHHSGSRKNGPFVGINCAALPELLLESELFGYEEGAFTGARKGGKLGRFELARGGTILLDEVGDLPLSMQVKLLRVLQEKKYERVGGTKSIDLNARIIAASNMDLKILVREGKFRVDLYYRVNVITLTLPPLRERKEDIPLLVGYFLQKIAEQKKAPPKIVSDKVLDLFSKYDWPGNVRELENVVERAVFISDGNVIHVEHLPPVLKSLTYEFTPKIIPIKDAVRELEKELIEEALKATNNNRVSAANLLGLPRATLYVKLKEYGLA
jgi:DNA-binding NtrC family response regulator/iron only hydrogenase large subunit-like protein